MRMDQDWDVVPPPASSRLGIAGTGALRIALLFGSIAVALGLIVAPIAQNQIERFAGTGKGDLDMMSTGSIAPKSTYTVRRSVLQRSPTAVCIIGQDGRQSGDCR